MSYEAKNIINGTFGTVWVDDEKISECSKLQAKISIQKEDVKMCGSLFVDAKMVGAKGTGSVTLYKVSSRFADVVSNELLDGKDYRCSIVSKLNDPDAKGTEQVVLTGVSFDDLTLADWEAAKYGSITAPFTFTGYKYLSKIN